MGREAFSIKAAIETYLDQLDDPRIDAKHKAHLRSQCLKLASNADKALVNAGAHLAFAIDSKDQSPWDV